MTRSLRSVFPAPALAAALLVAGLSAAAPSVASAAPGDAIRHHAGGVGTGPTDIVLADGRHWGGPPHHRRGKDWRGHDGRGYDWRDDRKRHWKAPHRRHDHGYVSTVVIRPLVVRPRYAPPPVYYTPPPAYYAAPLQPLVVQPAGPIVARTDGRLCREVIYDVTIGGRLQQAYGTACRQPDGSWAMAATR